MGDTSIEWTDKSWNPLAAYFEGKRGWMCSKPSPGCKNCYSERLNLRLGNGLLYTAENFAKVKWRAVNLDEPAKWRKPQHVFVESMGDLFHEALPDELIGRIWGAMLCYPQHIFQVLTKRADRMREIVTRLKKEGDRKELRSADHIWLGVSVENQEQADRRIPELLGTPAAVRFLSCEPLLGNIDLLQATPCGYYCDEKHGHVDHSLSGIHWVIVGGESGPNARPMHPDWARSLRDQCQNAEIPFFFKQWGEWLPYEFRRSMPPFYETPDGRLHDGHWLDIINPETGEENKEWDSGWWCIEEKLSDCAFRRVGKKSAGRLLDGREWNERPIAKGEGN